MGRDDLDVDPTWSCFNLTTANWANLSVHGVSNLMLLLWVPVPVLIWNTVRKHVFTNVTIEHEGYLLLKETEYLYGINDEWLLSKYFLHSSFRRPYVYMRVYMFVIKFVILICYGALFDYEQEQAFVYTGLFFAICIVLLIRRPFRLLSFNLILFLSFFVNFWNAFVGVCIELDTRNAFIQDNYLKVEMILLNGGFYFLCFIWFGFLFLRWKKICIRTYRPLWPNLTKTTTFKQDLDGLTRKYLVAIIRAQLILKETYNTRPLLAPAHELSRRIKILNAYCREAMYFDHVFQHTMWEVTDELIQAHTSVYKKSIFSDCSSYGSRESAKQLYEMLPTLAKRLKQRDEDLILMSRKRRRILLKMYTLSVFLSKHVDRVRRELAVAKETKGYDSDSDFEDDSWRRQENIPEKQEPGLPRSDSFLFEDSLVLDYSDADNSYGYTGLDNPYSNAGTDDPFGYNGIDNPYRSARIDAPYLNMDPPSSSSANVSYSVPETPGLVDTSYTSFEKDISALLDNSVFKEEGEPVIDEPRLASTPQRNKRASYAGVQQSDGFLSPSVERPFTTPYNNNNEQVLSFRRVS